MNYGAPHRSSHGASREMAPVVELPNLLRCRFENVGALSHVHSLLVVVDIATVPRRNYDCEHFRPERIDRTDPDARRRPDRVSERVVETLVKICATQIGSRDRPIIPNAVENDPASPAVEERSYLLGNCPHVGTRSLELVLLVLALLEDVQSFLGSGHPERPCLRPSL